MNGFARFNILVLALLSFASFCTARTIIPINGKCTTRYCNDPAAKWRVYRTTKVIHKTGRYTITRWKTVTKPKTTKTVTSTKKITSTVTKTIPTVVVITTKTSTVTKLYTSTVTTTNWIWTQPVTTKTIQSTSTIPAPAGFVGVNDENKAPKQALKFKPRDVEPESDDPDVELERRDAEPNAKPKYITAITCTKTMLTKTGTSDLWKTKTKTAGTVTKTIWKTETRRSTKTVTKKGAPTVRSTVTKIVSASAFVTLTATAHEISFISTVTTHLPQTTFLAACGAERNASPYAANGELDWYAVNPGILPGEKLEVILNNGSYYDCCVLCHTYSGPGICLGSVWNFQGAWGPPCEWEPPESCEPWIPRESARCELAIVDNKPGTCRSISYEFDWYFNVKPAFVSNGPNCKRFSYAQRKPLA